MHVCLRDEYINAIVAVIIVISIYVHLKEDVSRVENKKGLSPYWKKQKRIYKFARFIKIRRDLIRKSLGILGLYMINVPSFNKLTFLFSDKYYLYIFSSH